MRIVLLITTLALAAAGCARHAEVGTATVGPDYVAGGGEWNTGGGITTAVRVFEQDGATMVCGAWATDRQSVMSAGKNDGVIEAASVYAGGKRLVHNLSFMPRASGAGNLAGAQANCVRSSVPWRAEFAQGEPRVRIPRIVHAEVADEGGGGGSMLIFRETRRPDIVH